ncbi:hypothetical protein BG003_004820 [Podila horticola]|nr:hypothetical protein BG003_004820 [Podila horticola]
MFPPPAILPFLDLPSCASLPTVGAQVIAVGFICFCCPGMFNALNSLGGGGQLDSKVGQHANVALYTCFAIFGLLVGVIHNKLGPKWSIILGCVPTFFTPAVSSATTTPRTVSGSSLWDLVIITVCFVTTWVGRIFFQKGYKITDPKGNHDYTEGGSYVGPLFLYMFYGLNDAA